MVLMGPTQPDASPAEPAQAKATEPDAGSAEPAQEPTPEATPGGEPITAGGAAGPGGVEPPVSRSHRSPLVWLVPLVVVVVLGIGAGAFFLGRTTNSPAPASGPTTTTTTALKAPSAKMTTYRSSADGFSVQYPANWRRLDPGSAGGLLVSGGGQDAARIQVEQLARPVNTGNEADIKAFTDSVLSAKSLGLTVVLQRAVKLNGIIGYYYLYTFPYLGNQTGVHSLYFLFQGRKMTIITFQALPSSHFKALAPVFDKIALSYRSNPAVLGPPPPTATTATTAPASTTTTAKAKK